MGRTVREVEEYEINTALIEALNSVEKRAAIETGQEVDRSDIGVRFGLADQAAILQKAFTLDELEAIDARITAARNGTTPKQLEAPPVVPNVKPVPDKTHTQDRNDVAAAEAGDQAGSEAKWDPAGDGRAGRATEPGKLPGKPGCAAPTAPDPLGAGAAEAGVVRSVPKAPPSWRD